MKPPKPRPRIKILAAFLSGGLSLSLTAVLLTGITAAGFVAREQLQDSAQVAAFDVEVVPPDGVYTAEELADGVRNEIWQTNADRTEHIFTVTNHGEVSVWITPAVNAAGDEVWTLDTTPFMLLPGEWQEVPIVFEGSGTGLEQTVDDIDLILHIEQAD